MARADRKGFTLVELLAAISLLGIVMLGGIALLDQLGDSASRIATTGAATSREGNGARLLRRMLVDATTSPDSTKRFRGDDKSVELWTRCDVPSGWSEPCRVVLSIDQQPDSSILIADVSSGASFAVGRYVRGAAIRYYNAAAPADSAWVTQWSSNASLPIAIGVIAGPDTIVMPVSVAR